MTALSENHLTRKEVTFVIGLIILFVAAGVGWGSHEQQVAYLEARVEEVQTDYREVKVQLVEIQVQLARIESDIAHVRVFLENKDK